LTVTKKWYFHTTYWATHSAHSKPYWVHGQKNISTFRAIREEIRRIDRVIISYTKENQGKMYPKPRKTKEKYPKPRKTKKNQGKPTPKNQGFFRKKESRINTPKQTSPSF